MRRREPVLRSVFSCGAWACLLLGVTVAAGETEVGPRWSALLGPGAWTAVAIPAGRYAAAVRASELVYLTREQTESRSGRGVVVLELRADRTARLELRARGTRAGSISRFASRDGKDQRTRSELEEVESLDGQWSEEGGRLAIAFKDRAGWSLRCQRFEPAAGNRSVTTALLGCQLVGAEGPGALLAVPAVAGEHWFLLGADPGVRLHWDQSRWEGSADLRSGSCSAQKASEPIRIDSSPPSGLLE